MSLTSPAGVKGRDAFEPALTIAEEMESDTIWQCAADIPEEWYEGDRQGLHRLVETLHRRRALIRELIDGFRKSSGIHFRIDSDRTRWSRIAGFPPTGLPEIGINCRLQ